MNGGDDETRTRDLCRDSGPLIGFTTTYKSAGTAKHRVSRTRHRILWVELWVGEKASMLFLRTWRSRSDRQHCERGTDGYQDRALAPQVANIGP